MMFSSNFDSANKIDRERRIEKERMDRLDSIIQDIFFIERKYEEDTTVRKHLFNARAEINFAINSSFINNDN